MLCIRASRGRRWMLCFMRGRLALSFHWEPPDSWKLTKTCKCFSGCFLNIYKNYFSFPCRDEHRRVAIKPQNTHGVTVTEATGRCVYEQSKLPHQSSDVMETTRGPLLFIAGSTLYRGLLCTLLHLCFKLPTISPPAPISPNRNRCLQSGGEGERGTRTMGSHLLLRACCKSESWLLCLEGSTLSLR